MRDAKERKKNNRGREWSLVISVRRCVCVCVYDVAVVCMGGGRCGIMACGKNVFRFFISYIVQGHLDHAYDKYCIIALRDRELCANMGSLSLSVSLCLSLSVSVSLSLSLSVSLSLSLSVSLSLCLSLSVCLSLSLYLCLSLSLSLCLSLSVSLSLSLSLSHCLCLSLSLSLSLSLRRKLK